MTKEEILQMPEGEELDILVAERVMGWHTKISEWGTKCWVDSENRFMCGYPRYGEYEDAEDFHTLKWHPSESILWAWDVIEKSQSFAMNNSVSQEESADGVRRWTAEIFFDKWGLGEAETAPLAICRAALLATI